MVRRVKTISLEAVKTALRRGGSGYVENAGGWCVFVDREGQHLYVVSELSAAPVPFHELSPLRQALKNQPLTLSTHLYG